MKAPQNVDPDMLTILEITQHAAEILSRIPLSMLRSHLQQHRDDDPAAEWYTKALNVVFAAEQFDAAQGLLSAEEHRAAPAAAAAAPLPPVPDDWVIT